MSSLTTAARRLLDHVASTPWESSTWDPVTRFPPLQILGGGTNGVAYVAKLPLYEFVQRRVPGWPEDITVLHRVGLFHSSLRPFVAVAEHGARLTFFGDLEPFGLAVFLSLLAGGADANDHRPGVDANWGGINDAWLEIAERSIIEPYKSDHARFGDPIIPKLKLTAGARALFAALDDGSMDWDSLIGKRSVAMLRQGYGFPLDMACEAKYFDGSYPEKVVGHVLGSIGSLAGAAGA